MTLMNAESLKDSWSAIFRRKGGNGATTRLFDSLDPIKKSEILTLVKLDRAELPVIGQLLDAQNWFLLTTKRLVWTIESEHHELDNSAIVDATIDLDVASLGRNKMAVRQLSIEVLDGGTQFLELEPGLPLSGVWNVLKNIGTRNRKSSQRSKRSPDR